MRVRVVIDRIVLHGFTAAVSKTELIGDGLRESLSRLVRDRVMEEPGILPPGHGYGRERVVMRMRGSADAFSVGHSLGESVADCVWSSPTGSRSAK